MWSGYTWDQEDRMIRAEARDWDDILIKGVEYRYCPSCGGALSERIEYNANEQVVSWLRYEYEGLNLLRIDEVYDYDGDEVLEDPADGEDRWRPLNVYVRGPGLIGQVVRAHWYAYPEDGASWCYEGNYYYACDALGNALGVFQYGDFYRWETDAFGNDLPGGNQFLPMDEEGPKERLTGKMFDTATGLYYFQARWLDPEVGRFVSRDPEVGGGAGSTFRGERGAGAKSSPSEGCGGSSCLYTPTNLMQPSLLQAYAFAGNSPTLYVDPTGRKWYHGLCKVLCMAACAVSPMPPTPAGKLLCFMACDVLCAPPAWGDDCEKIDGCVWECKHYFDSGDILTYLKCYSKCEERKRRITA